ncbi:MAG: hypothetical protein ABJQ34_06950 [Paracoccaceae bacterium]
MITECEREVNELHAALWKAVEHRGKSPHQREQWHRAADAFNNHQSPIDDLIDRCFEYGLERDSDLRRFAFAYIDEDPYFFRSGYILEDLLRRVKRLTLSTDEKTSLQRLILKRIETRALRNFRRICQLINKIDTDDFRNEVCNRTNSSDPQVKRRAEFALSYFPNNTQR